jgi:histidinol-phosphate/aromatic aminotransferase/cobyric acid decarboxylase-like protein
MRSLAPPAGAHGGDGGRLARTLGVAAAAVLDLSASLNPLAPDAGPVVARYLDAIGRYPDAGPARAALAACMGVEADRLLLTNGGAEGIALVAGDVEAGWVDEPEFSLYRRHLRTLDRGAGRWRSNPHNPSGLLAGPAETARVWDEAFWPLATGTWTRGDAEVGAIVIGSLTKMLACPGLRIGYVLTPTAAMTARLEARQPQWALNGLAAAALPELLATVDLPRWAAGIVRLRHDLVATLCDAGYQPAPSQANWVLVRAPGLRERLAAAAILVRDCDSFGLPGTVRIAVPDAQGLVRLRGAL